MDVRCRQCRSEVIKVRGDPLFWLFVDLNEPDGRGMLHAEANEVRESSDMHHRDCLTAEASKEKSDGSKMHQSTSSKS
jgi:hypothetical protein